MPKFSTFKPYLFNAYYNWFVDNAITPHLLVDASNEDVIVPKEHVHNNSIVLSIAPAAIADLDVKNSGISFKAMFHGHSEDVYVPYNSMMQLIAVETGGGLPIGQALEAFDIREAGDDEEDLEENFENSQDDPDFMKVAEKTDSDISPETVPLPEMPDEDPAPAFSIVQDDTDNK